MLSTSSKCFTCAYRSLGAQSTRRSSSTTSALATSSSSGLSSTSSVQQHNKSASSSSGHASTATIRLSEKKKKLALLQAMSLYHQSSKFPNFSHEPQLIKKPLLSDSKTIILPPPIDRYVRIKIKSIAPAPLTDGLTLQSIRGASSSSNAKHLSAKWNRHSYMDEGERRILKLGFTGRESSNNDKIPSKPWKALAPQLPRESRRRALRMIDALYGTVDAKQAGPSLVQDVKEANDAFAARLKERRESQQ